MLQHLHHDLPAARPVELAEVDGLPGSEHQPSLRNGDRHAGTHETGFQVGVGIPFGVVLVAAQRHQATCTHASFLVLINGWLFFYLPTGHWAAGPPW